MDKKRSKVSPYDQLDGLKQDTFWKYDFIIGTDSMFEISH